MSLFSDLKALYDAISADQRNWKTILDAFMKVAAHFFSDSPPTVGDDGETGDAKELAQQILAKCEAPATFGADGVGANGEKILEFIKLVLPLIIKWL